MAVHHAHAWFTQRSEEGIRSLGTEVKDDGELPCGRWEPNSGPLQVVASDLNHRAMSIAEASLHVYVVYMSTDAGN